MKITVKSTLANIAFIILLMGLAKHKVKSKLYTSAKWLMTGIKYCIAIIVITLIFGHGTYYIALIPFMTMILVAMFFTYSILSFLINRKTSKFRLSLIFMLIATAITILTVLIFSRYIQDITGHEIQRSPKFSFIDPSYLPTDYVNLGQIFSTTKTSITKSYVSKSSANKGILLITERTSKTGKTALDCKEHWTSCSLIYEGKQTIYAHYFLGKPDYFYCNAGKFSVEIDINGNSEIGIDEIAKTCASIKP